MEISDILKYIEFFKEKYVMAQIYRDRIIKLEQIDISSTEDMFSRILEEKKQEIDNVRFFISYIPSEELAKYDFNNNHSLNQFRQACISIDDPLKPMGGCNLREEELRKGIRYAGMKLSDPYGLVPGVFDINNRIITYSPIFPLFYDERDNIKFAKDTYFTSMTFQEIIINQINNAMEYYLHVGNYSTARDILKYGSYIFERINKEQMLEFVTNPEKGQKVLSRHLGLK